MDAREQFEKWYLDQSRDGDPRNRPHLVRDAYLAALKSNAEEIEGLRANHQPLQARASTWATAAFGLDDVMNKKLRALRFIEEAIELVQAADLSLEDVNATALMVYRKPVGETKQEVGGVLVTLAVFCHAHGIQMMRAGMIELERCWQKIDQIRTKNSNKPRPTS